MKFEAPTVDGRCIEGFELWRLLAEIDANEATLRTMVWLCHCDAGTCDNVPHTPIFGRSWDRCPYQYLRSAQWATVVWLQRVAQFAPPSGWPLGYAAWIVDAVCSLQAEQQRQAARRRR